MSKDNINARGNKIAHNFILNGNRYQFDFNVCKSANGWKQFDTTQDASYFGIWVHIKERKIVIYAEGDVSIIECPDDEHLQAELKYMEELYGAPPPAAISYDANGKRTEFYDKRPTVPENTKKTVIL